MPAPAVYQTGEILLTVLDGTERIEVDNGHPIMTEATAATLSGLLPSAKYTTAALQSTVIPAANLTGAGDVNFDNTGVTPGNLQFPLASDLIAALPVGLRVSGFSYALAIRNSSSAANPATITTNTGITLTGTMTIAQNTTRYFVVTLGTPVAGVATTATVQSMGVSAAAL